MLFSTQNLIVDNPPNNRRWVTTSFPSEGDKFYTASFFVYEGREGREDSLKATLKEGLQTVLLNFSHALNCWRWSPRDDSSLSIWEQRRQFEWAPETQNSAAWDMNMNFRAVGGSSNNRKQKKHSGSQPRINKTQLMRNYPLLEFWGTEIPSLNVLLFTDRYWCVAFFNTPNFW